MADEDSDNASGEGGGKKNVVLFAVLIVLVIALSIGGTYAALEIFGEKEVPVDPNAEGQQEVVEESKKDAIYFPLKPSIIVNFSVKGRQRFAQVDITLMTREEDVVSAVELHAPMIRNAMILIIGGQVYADVLTAEGKELLRQQCLQEIQTLLEKEIGKKGVEQALFTNFVMQ